ncbi:hypothetical protein [Gordonia rhizosphera]|uniref:hypothetical protein n=1 Tax=Gordonia rhizosphera TaxID=83341 RepID=UPI0002E096AB|nr:hypothetical protein [Gordonia rhizosphera]
MDGNACVVTITVGDHARRRHPHGDLRRRWTRTRTHRRPVLDGPGALLVWNATLRAAPDVVAAVEALYDAGLGRLGELFG